MDSPLLREDEKIQLKEQVAKKGSEINGENIVLRSSIVLRSKGNDEAFIEYEGGR